MAPPRHEKNDINTILGQEPVDKESIEHKDWELAYLKLQLERKRTTIRIAREGKQKQIATLQAKLNSSVEALQKSKEHEIEALKHEIEGLKQERNHYRDMASFRQVAENGDAVVEELSVKIDGLESHIDHQNDTIKELEEVIVELQVDKTQLMSKTVQNNSTGRVNTLMREHQEQQFTITEKDNKILQLEAEKAEYVQREEKMMAQIGSLLNEKLELQIKCRKLHEQVGSTAKPTLKAKTVYQRKPNLTQKSLNTMFHDQSTSSAASSPASTQSAPSPIVSTRHTTSTAAVSATASPTTVKPNENTNKIPLKRALSATLSDKTNGKVLVLARDSKEKGRVVEVKQEQVDIDVSTELENAPDQAVDTARDASTTRKKPNSNASITTASSSSTRSIVEPTSPPTKPFVRRFVADPVSASVTSTARRIAKPTSAPTTPATSFAACNTSHRKDRGNMRGETCTACVNFYGTETITANIDGQQLQLTGQDRIQCNSRHRQHRNQRSNTPPGFWDLDFQTPERPGF